MDQQEIDEENKDAVIQRLVLDKEELRADLASANRECCDLRESLKNEMDQRLNLQHQMQLLMRQRLRSSVSSDSMDDVVEHIQEIDTLREQNHELNALVKTLKWSLRTLGNDQPSKPQKLELETMRQESVAMKEVHIGRATTSRTTTSRTTPRIRHSLTAPLPPAPMRRLSGLFGRRLSVSPNSKVPSQELVDSERVSIEFKALSQKLARDIGDKEAEVMHLNKLKMVLIERVMELEEANKTLRGPSTVLGVEEDVSTMNIQMVPREIG